MRNATPPPYAFARYSTGPTLAKGETHSRVRYTAGDTASDVRTFAVPCAQRLHGEVHMGLDDGTLDIGHATTGANQWVGIQGGAASPGPVAAGDATPLSNQRIIAQVTKDWDPPNPRRTPAITVGGATLEAAGRELDKLNEW